MESLSTALTGPGQIFSSPYEIHQRRVCDVDIKTLRKLHIRKYGIFQIMKTGTKVPGKGCYRYYVYFDSTWDYYMLFLIKSYFIVERIWHH